MPRRTPAVVEAKPKVVTFGRVAFNERLNGLLAERTALDVRIDEMRSWLALLDQAEGQG